ncbi:hypothetical protein ARMSODRAFT_963556 [Armillaria solidipes]|uniref:DUF6534 domain-containing protein n=1 Tax=Armillaria solidipes TaxID=1076256 RepID=A0A2H3B291_9AGAR|nr:hypothetical protein ARMSODRAFT_963556 [Armillaria solidipes]
MASLLSRSPTSLGNTLGALYVGATIAAIFFGITNLQTLIYYKRYPNDWWIYRYSIALLWVLDALHVALSTHALYCLLIDWYGNVAAERENDEWSFKVSCLYWFRLYKLGRHFHKILPWFVFLAVVTSLGAGIFMVYGIYATANFTSITYTGFPVYIFFSTIVVADLLIALMMCYYLHQSRAAMNHSTTTTFLVRLMRLILVSGLATSACSLLTLIAYIVWRDSLIFLGIDFILPKLYVNSLLAMFNYRHKHRSNKSTEERGGHSISATLQFAPHSSEDSTAETNINIPLRPPGYS